MITTRQARRAAGAVVVASSVTLLAPPASAQPSAAAVAQVLFEEGVALMEQQRYEEACPKLAESQRIDPGGGTLLNLGACLEQTGKLASAYATYNEALSAAIRDGRKDREASSREKLASIRPRMSHARLFAPQVVGLEVLLDDTSIGPAAWGLSLPIDPGHHVVRASAPGHASWEAGFEVRSAPAVHEVRIPHLVSLAPSRAAPLGRTPGDEDPSPGRRSAAVGFGLGGAGLLVVGGVSGGLAFAQKAASDDACPTRSTCTPEGAAAMDRAVGFAWGSTAAIGLGLVALGVCGYLAWSSHASVARTKVGLTPVGSLTW